MSFRHTKSAWAGAIKRAPSSMAALVYAFLCDQASDTNGECWCSYDRCHEFTQISRNTYFKALGQLKEAGLIELGKKQYGGANRVKLVEQNMPSNVPEEDVYEVENDSANSIKFNTPIVSNLIRSNRIKFNTPTVSNLSTNRIKFNTPIVSNLIHNPCNTQVISQVKLPVEETAPLETAPSKTQKDLISPEKIKSIFEEVLPELSQVRVLTDKRKSAIRARALEAKKLEGLNDDELEGWFRKLFEAVQESDFLMGRTKRGGKDWQATFDWILKPDSCNRILEGAYRNNKPRGIGGKNMPDTSTIDYHAGLYD